MTRSASALLQLLRISIGGKPQDDILTALSPQEWKELIYLSFEQWVPALAVDGYNRWQDEYADKALECSLECSEPMKGLKFEWLGSVLQAEVMYSAYKKAVKSLAMFYSENSGGEMLMMVLKGYGLSLNYPQPSHRPNGDIDIYLGEKWREADEVVKRLGVKIDYSHHHHSVFFWRGHVVENHYDIVNRYFSREGKYYDDVLKKLAAVNYSEVSIDDTKILLPSPTFNGVFLLWHTAAHFASTSINLRHLLDWALFVDRFSDDIDWNTVTEHAARGGHLRFLSCLNGLSIDYIGIQAGKFPALKRDTALEERILSEIIRPSFQENGSGLMFRLRRLRANNWKRTLVYPEPYIPRMLRLAWSHILRPESNL